jgi:hypothetical protein
MALAETMNERGRSGLQDRVRRLIKDHNRLIEPVRFYHTWDSRKSEPGFPDCVIVLPVQGRTLFVELKKQHAGMSPEQGAWLRDLSETKGVECYLWRPIHLVTGKIGDVLVGPKGVEHGRLWPEKARDGR